MAIEIYHPRDEEKSSFEVMPLAFQLADKLAATEFVPVALKNRPAAIAAAILTGHEVGLPPMASLQHINVIQGRPTLSAAAMRGLILAHGHRIWVEEQTITRATVCSQRRGEDRVSTVSWTLDDAKRAKLEHKDNWQHYPRNMLVARATGDNARANFIDVLSGIAYTTEEAQDMDEGVALTPAEGRAETPPPGTVRRRAKHAATAALPSGPPPAPEPEGEEKTVARESEPPPGPAADAVPDAGSDSSTTSEERKAEPAPPAGDDLVDPSRVAAMSLAQQVAMVCREAGIDRANLIAAVTGKERARDLTRPEAQDILDKAKAIQRGELKLEERDGSWVVFAIEPAPVNDDPGAAFRH
jgi:hypothetical protein